MRDLIAEFRKSLAAAVARQEAMQAERMRFLAGLAVTGGGAGIFLADLLARLV